MHKGASGFTLIELMMVVGLLAIITVVAIPVYNNQVEKTRRADAKASLLNAAQQLERCFTRTNTYLNCDVPATSQDGFYTIAATTQTATTYALAATADPEGPQKNDACSPFTLDHLGNRDAGSETDRCWGS